MIEERLKNIRKSTGLSQRKFADKVGVSFGSIQNYEKDASALTISTAIKISGICGYNSNWLLTGIGDMKIDINNLSLETASSSISAVINQTGIIEQFKDQESALEISQDLLYIETQSRETFEKAKNIIKGMKEAVSVKTDSAHSSNGKKNSGFWNGQERRQKKTG